MDTEQQRNIESLEAEIKRLHAVVEETQKQLMLAQKMGSIGELASSITHEFNNILTTVINYAKLGLRHTDQTQRDKAFNKILSAGQRAAKITTGMLSYARSGNDRKEAHSLTQLVNDIVVLVEKDLHIHRITLETKIESEPYVLVNPGQLQQVLLNLIVNARQAMQPGGTLTIIVSEDQEKQSAIVSVQDTGEGIPAESLGKIFDRFYTTKTADKHGQGGTGLGLPLCKDVVEAHSGRIRVESAVGHGTRFNLIFPLIAKPTLMANVSRAS